MSWSWHYYASYTETEFLFKQGKYYSWKTLWPSPHSVHTLTSSIPVMQSEHVNNNRKHSTPMHKSRRWALHLVLTFTIAQSSSFHMVTLANRLHFNSMASVFMSNNVRMASVVFHLLFGDMLFSSAFQPQLPGCSACTSFHRDSCEESSAGASLLRLCLVLLVWPEVTFKWGFVGNTCHWAPQAMLTVAKSHLCNEFVRATVIMVLKRPAFHICEQSTLLYHMCLIYINVRTHMSVLHTQNPNQAHCQVCLHTCETNQATSKNAKNELQQ